MLSLEYSLILQGFNFDLDSRFSEEEEEQEEEEAYTRKTVTGKVDNDREPISQSWDEQ
jgi:hypothetical protein